MKRKWGGPQWAMLVVLLLLAGWLGMRSQSNQDQARENAAQHGCELIHEEPCVYDNRFEEWVRESQAR